MTASVIWGVSGAIFFAGAVFLGPRVPGAVAPRILRRALDGVAIFCVVIAAISAR